MKFAFPRGSDHHGHPVEDGNVPEGATVVEVTPYKGPAVKAGPTNRGAPLFEAHGGNKRQKGEALRNAGEPYHR